MKVRELLMVLPITTVRVFRDWTTGEDLNYYDMDREHKESLREWEVVVASPLSKAVVEIFVR